MEAMRETLPDLAESVSSPNLSSITQFFCSKHFTESDTNQNKESKVGGDMSLKELEGPRAPHICDRYVV